MIWGEIQGNMKLLKKCGEEWPGLAVQRWESDGPDVGSRQL
jgi:hypothetical protein